MITLNQISLARGAKLLLNEVSISLFAQQKIGLIGQNGCGKSTLFDFLLGKIPAEKGDYQASAQLSISHLAQELPHSEEKALDFVLAGDEGYLSLMQRLTQAEQTQDDAEVLACHEMLAQSSGYSKPAQAATIMSGLGFKAEQQQNPVNSFSGGWRMRLNLARCLMNPAQLFLLDEPTNHLDMEALFWLERFLKQSASTLIIISHDREFLDAVVSHIFHLDNQKIKAYTGNYSAFEKAQAESLALQQKMHEKQEAKIKHLLSFVTRFKAKATKAKQAQSRIKAIEKMELIAAVQANSSFSFDFYPCPQAGRPLLQCKELSAGYSPHKAILKKINLTLQPGDRIAFLGPNGEGKSTLIKTLTGLLSPLEGEFYQAPKLNIAYYAQHQLEQLDCNLSPVETLQQLTPEVREQSIRDFLGGFNFRADTAMQPILHFSGGEKARLALAKLVWLRPNLLLLDEPTNHLDLEMRAALELALQSYEGALILISHDRHLLKTAVDSFYLIHQQKVKPFEGDLDDYYTWLQTKNPVKEQNLQEEKNDYKQKKNFANRLKKLELLIEQAQKELAELDKQLTDPSLYEEQNQKKLEALLRNRKQAQDLVHQREQEWMDLSLELEEE